MKSRLQEMLPEMYPELDEAEYDPELIILSNQLASTFDYRFNPPDPPQVPPSDDDECFSGLCKLVNGPLVVGSGPSGMAVAAGLIREGVPLVILEKGDCFAPLWQHGTYNRLKLNLPKKYCQLPYIRLPPNFPVILSKKQFIDYVEYYARSFKIAPRFNEAVLSAKYDETCGLWHVQTYNSVGNSTVVYICRWLVVATGENAEKVVPTFEGFDDFKGSAIHACEYKSGESYRGKRVLVVGSGNSGIDISLDLCEYNAFPLMVVRGSVRELPSEISGQFKIVPEIKKFSAWSVELVSGEVVKIDSVIWATGYTSNVKSWLQENELFSSNGYPNGWKGRGGLYAVGFTRRGLLGASVDAINVAADIIKLWKQKSKYSPFTDIKFLQEPEKEEQRLHKRRMQGVAMCR